MKRTKTLGMVFLSGTIVLSAAVIQAATVTAKGPIPFSTYDADGNGGISQQEFTAARTRHQDAVQSSGRQGRGMANAPSFSVIDTDSDGQISSQELAAYQNQRRSGRGMGGGRGMGKGAGPNN